MAYRETSMYDELVDKIIADFHAVGVPRGTILQSVERRYKSSSVVVKSATDFVTPLSDEQAVALLVANGKSEDEVKAVVRAWRNLAMSVNYNGTIAYRVKAGFTLKKHAPRLGLCYKNWDHLQDWNFKNDIPTQDSLVFWIPRLVPNSTSKNVNEQLGLLAELRKEYKLPNSHLTSFGDASLLSALVLSYYEQTNDERVPLNHLYVRTDTLLVDGYRLGLGDFDGDGSLLRLLALARRSRLQSRLFCFGGGDT